MDITEKLTKVLQESLSKKQIELGDIEIVVEIPKDSANGDYASNVAMRLSSVLRKNPMDIAKDIVSGLDDDPYISKVEIAKPGFINFFLSNKYFLDVLLDMQKEGSKYFEFEKKKDRRILVEYTDANPFKEFHIGHLYSNAVGESFSRLQEALGAKVERACYQGDVGLHVAKTMWGLEKKMEEDSLQFEDIEKQSLSQRVGYLGSAYVFGASYYDELKDESAIQEISDFNYYIFSLTSDLLEKKDFSKFEKLNVEEKYRKGRQWCLDYFEEIYKKVGTKFDYYFFESEVGEDGLKLVLENVGKVFEKDDGAVIYRGDEEKNLHTRVFVNQHGLPTYEAKEIGLAFKRKEIVDCDESIVITADEQSGYFKVVLDALSKIDIKLSEGIKHFAHGKVKLPGAKKMSSRKGGILSGEWLMDETQKKVQEIMKENTKYDDKSINEISERIAIGAIKYSFLKVGVGRDIVFDLDKSITFDGDTGPYLMYVYSRCKSLLSESETEGDKIVDEGSTLENLDSKRLVSCISKYRKYLLDSAMEYSPSILCQYLFDLGQNFNSFYQNVRILDSSKEERQTLLLLVRGTMVVMEDGLSKLGIRVVERM